MLKVHPAPNPTISFYILYHSLISPAHITCTRYKRISLFITRLPYGDAGCTTLRRDHLLRSWAPRDNTVCAGIPRAHRPVRGRAPAGTAALANTSLFGEPRATQRMGRCVVGWERGYREKKIHKQRVASEAKKADRARTTDVEKETH